ncbi:hypothetical protein BASA61_003746 [Batrachochytrium salamandrivorans]|nr:hypothetical protein BASA62_003389 [Batrachochytrium salamandrivorans]KAH6580352.1 hypothetical protein BASA60_002885 [Batrachochytrium salamandrivorans]KAH6595647.1 hypothetical protein BASA61_003746 [Batrachochytrium salamandrivorans]
MISLYGLFILILTAETIHARGNKNDGDGVDQSSGSKDAPKKDTSLLQRTTSTTLPTTLQESSTPDQNGASLSVDSQPGKEFKSSFWMRLSSKSCPQQQSPPGSQPSPSHDSSQPDEMPLPIRVGESEVESYSEIRETDQYRDFTKEEAEYFESEYSLKKKLGEGKNGMIFLAIQKSNGMEVAYKSIINSNIRNYALESIPPSRCHIPNPPSCYKKLAVEKCMSPRPPKLLVPYEFMAQRYLSRPGHDNPYVPVVFDYYILEDRCIVVMEHLDGNWVDLSKYVDEKGQLDIKTAQDIVREIVKAMIYLKKHGILHGDFHGMFQ